MTVSDSPTALGRLVLRHDLGALSAVITLTIDFENYFFAFLSGRAKINLPNDKGASTKRAELQSALSKLNQIKQKEREITLLRLQ